METQRHDAINSITSALKDKGLLSTTVFGMMEEYSRSLAAVQTSIGKLAEADKLQVLEQEVGRVVAQAQRDFASISEKMDSLSQDAGALANIVQELNGFTEKIDNITLTIERIAAQTKLLSLNATIEATHAGEHGKGFIVVAKEVKELADQTNRSAKEIATIIGNARHMMHHMQTQADKTLTNIVEVNRERENRKNGIESLSAISGNVKDSASLRGFVEAVKVDHLVWKLDIYKVVMGISQQTPADFASYHHCRLGRWYYTGQGRELFAEMQAFKDLEAPHRLVHQCGIEALKLFSDRAYLPMKEELSAMEKASMEVLELLEQIGDSDTPAVNQGLR
jgi:hypothetical protein